MFVLLGRSEGDFDVSSGSDSEASPLQSDTKDPRSTRKTSTVSSKGGFKVRLIYMSVTCGALIVNRRSVQVHVVISEEVRECSR